MTASGEVRLVPMSREQQLRLYAGEHGSAGAMWHEGKPVNVEAEICEAWSAAVPGVVAKVGGEFGQQLHLRAEDVGDRTVCVDHGHTLDTLLSEEEICETLVEGGPWSEIDGDGTPTTVILDCISQAAGALKREHEADEAGGEVAAERSLASRGDAVWTVDDLPHLLDEQVERPSVSLRETIETHLRANEWEDKDGYWFWRNSGLGIAIEYAVGHQLKVEREAEGKNAMSERMMKDWTS